MRLIDADAAIEAVEKSMYENPHENAILRGMHDHEHRHFLTILMGLPSARPKQRWIPVTEILPENDDKVLITHSHGISMAWWNGRYWTGSMIKKYKTVMAWMPLPEPYQEGGQE